MSKKTFKDNPALQFITEPEEKPEQNSNQEAQTQPSMKPPKGYKLNPMYVEVKSRRLQLALQPSLYKRVKAAADMYGLSVNEYIHRTLDIATQSDEGEE